MLKVGYLVDSAANITKEFESHEILKKIEFLSFVVIDPDSNEYSEDKITISQEKLSELFNKFPKRGLKTSLTPRLKIEEKLDMMLEKYDYVIGLPIARGLSKQASSFESVANSEKYKGRFFDFGKRNAADMIISNIAEIDKEIESLEKLDKEIIDELKVTLKKKIDSKLILYVSKLDRLLMSGRISKAKAVIGKLIQLKVSFTLDDEKVALINKGRSIFHLVDSSIQKTKSELQKGIKNCSLQAVVYFFNVEKEVKEKIVSICKDIVGKVSIEQFPSIYLVHLGPGTIAINVTARKEALNT